MTNTTLLGKMVTGHGSLEVRIFEPYTLSAWPTYDEVVHHAGPRRGLPEVVNDWRLENVGRVLEAWRRLDAMRRVITELAVPAMTAWGALWIDRITVDGERIHYGLASLRVVTNAGVNYLVDALQNLVEPENLKFHGIGTGTNAEAAADTALQTELTTQYNPDNTRATGSLTEGASANVWRTVGTNTVDAAVTITEHGIFSQAATGGGTLLDRSVFAGIALASGESLQTTYDLTINAGG